MEDTISHLKAELRAAVTAHYQKLTSEVPDIYGYGLFSDGGVCSLGPVANRESSLTVDASDSLYNYYRYLAVEWTDLDDFGLFSRVNKIVTELHADNSKEFCVKRDAILDACLDVMVELESGGLFGLRTDDRFITICLSDSDNPIMMKAAKQLNTSVAFEAYASEF